LSKGFVESGAEAPHLYLQDASRFLSAEFGVGVFEEVDGGFGGFGLEEVFAGFGVAEDSAHAAEEVEVFGEAGGGEEEEEFYRAIVGGAPIDAGVVAAEHDNGFFEDVADGVASVGKGEAVADGGGVKFFAVDQGLPEGELFGGEVMEFGDEVDEFAQGVVAGLALQAEVDGFGIQIGGYAHGAIKAE